MKDGKIDRRKTYFIDKKFQAKFIIKFCLLVIIASLLTGISIYCFNLGTTTVAFEHSKVLVKSTGDFILPITLQILVIVTLLVSIATAAVALFTSNRISGPLFRFKAELEKMKSGDFSSSIRIRTEDQLQKMAHEIEETRISVKDSITVLKAHWNFMKIDLNSLKEEIKDERKKSIFVNCIEHIDSELARFKIE